MTRHEGGCLCGGIRYAALAKPMRGEILVCPDCGAELEVVSEQPFRLELAPKEEEDWGE